MAVGAQNGTVRTDPVPVRTVDAPRWEAVLHAAPVASADDLVTCSDRRADAVEAALADALERAAGAGQWVARPGGRHGPGGGSGAVEGALRDARAAPSAT